MLMLFVLVICKGSMILAIFSGLHWLIGHFTIYSWLVQGRSVVIINIMIIDSLGFSNTSQRLTLTACFPSDCAARPVAGCDRWLDLFIVHGKIMWQYSRCLVEAGGGRAACQGGPIVNSPSFDNFDNVLFPTRKILNLTTGVEPKNIPVRAG